MKRSKLLRNNSTKIRELAKEFKETASLINERVRFFEKYCGIQEETIEQQEKTIKTIKTQGEAMEKRNEYQHNSMIRKDKELKITNDALNISSQKEKIFKLLSICLSVIMLIRGLFEYWSNVG